MIKNKRAKSISILFMIATVFSAPVSASEGMFHYCFADVPQQKKFYITELKEGSIKIADTQKLRSYLVEKLGLNSLTVSCNTYGNKTKSVQVEVAQKLRTLEIRKKQIMSEIVPLVWTPD